MELSDIQGCCFFSFFCWGGGGGSGPLIAVNVGIYGVPLLEGILTVTRAHLESIEYRNIEHTIQNILNPKP